MNMQVYFGQKWEGRSKKPEVRSQQSGNNIKLYLFHADKDGVVNFYHMNVLWWNNDYEKGGVI